MIYSTILSTALTDRFGLDINVEVNRKQEGQIIRIRPSEIEESKSFSIELLLGWRSLVAKYIPGRFASSLIHSMSQASKDQKKLFSVFASSLLEKGANLELNINGQLSSPLNYDQWPLRWKNISIEMRKIGVLVEIDRDYSFSEVYPWATGFLGMIISLLPLEEIGGETYVGEPEGAVKYKTAKDYERSRINRAACIEIHGTSCEVCGINFGKIYGNLGEGFIHVHHILPLSEMGEEYVLDPSNDLIPVCPNCHSMLHRRIPALTVEELKWMFFSSE